MLRSARHRPVVLLACLAGAALAPAAPALACPDEPASAAFASFGDDSLYAPVPGGTFERELNWSHTGIAALVAENNPFDVAGVGSSSVRLGPGGTITSPDLCLNRDRPHLRFLARAEHKANLKLEVLWQDGKGKHKVEPLSDERSDRYSTWGPSKIIKFKKVLPKDETVRDVRLRFAVRGGAGSWLVDDVLIDPVKRG